MFRRKKKCYKNIDRLLNLLIQSFKSVDIMAASGQNLNDFAKFRQVSRLKATLFVFSTKYI